MSDAHRKVERLNKFFAVANPEVRSYCDVGVGPLGRWIAVFAGIQGDISIDVTRMPSRLKSKGTLWPEQSCGTWQSAAGSGTSPKGGVTWS